MQEEKLESIDGTVDSVLFSNPSNGYVVLELDRGGDFTTVTGNLGNIEVGESVSVSGRFVMHPKFGSQFAAEICQRKMPETAAAMLKYLSSGVIKGIGPTLAKRIVDEFGGRTFEVLEKEPEKLSAIKGFTAKKIEEISLDFKRIYGIRALMIYLSQYNIQPSYAMRAWKKWGQYAVDIIKENPYCLCEFGIELEFKRAEAIALQLGLPPDKEERIKVGVAHVLIQNAFAGHTCLPYDILISMSQKLLGVSSELIEKSIDGECNESNLDIYEKDGRNYVFLHDYFIAEQYITGRLGVLNSFMKDTKYDYAKLIDIEEKSKAITYAEQQRKAISLALSKGFIILTGGPGTGKTTTLKAIISLYEQRGMKVQIAAPTGKAAKRISDLTGYEAKTIHRLLEVSFDDGGKPAFKHNEREPLMCDVIIIDEMSMVDTLLFESLLRALKLSCRLIMVGDSDQLPSVGAGNVLKDMIDSDKLSVVQLTEIFRQAQLSTIITNAHKIVSGEMPDLTKTDSDFFFMQRIDIQKASDTVVELYAQRLPNAYGMSPIDDIQVLCPSRKGAVGVIEMNKLLQFALNPPERGKGEIMGVYYSYRDNDKVMQIKNNYDILWKKDGETGAGIFNGDIGTVVKISKQTGTMVIDFEGRITQYSSEMLDQLELAYAITVHKSQGSEFNAVIIPLLGGFEKLYYRNLLYTAVTRAKKLLIIVGSKQVVMKMVANNRRTLRYSCLKDMIVKELGNGQAICEQG